MSKVISAHAVSVDGYTLITAGIQDAISAARRAADGKDVGLMGGGVRLRLLEAVPAPGVTHLHYEVVR